jgi:hypothetical protein
MLGTLVKMLLLAYLVLFLVVHHQRARTTTDDDIISLTPQVVFYTKKQTRAFILADADNFIRTLDRANCLARQVQTPDEYLRTSAHAATDFTPAEKQRLERAVRAASQMLARMSARALGKYGLDKAQMLSLLPVWTLAKTTDQNVEMGMPHTRQHVIFLSGSFLNKSKKLTRTLIHEFTHLYQRAFAARYNAFLLAHEWTRVPYNENDLRINPDLEKQVWKRGERVFIAKFTSMNPKNLRDVQLTQSRYEHPYEWYAYRLSEAATTQQQQQLN